LDEAVAEEGDFRRRICELLAHPAWLDRLRECGAEARRLELPDPGHMRRIGYSVRLAFPQRRDRERLAGLFADRADAAVVSTTLPEAFALVESHARQFSDDFRAVFRSAKDILARGGDGPDLRLVWSALREAATLTPASRNGTTKPRFHLIAYDDDRARL
jgi:hypothetical protein